MPSNARAAFDDSAQDIKRLLRIHSLLGGNARGRRFELEVLNKSAIVLITAIWEAYCEDLAAEALAHIVKYSKTPDCLSLDLRRKMVKDLKEDKNELAIWQLADWKKALESRLRKLQNERNWKLNSPKSSNIVSLFADAIGLADVSERWHWRRQTVVGAKTKLNKYVELRGAIAHRGRSDISCTKANVRDYFQHVSRLVAKTGLSVNSHIKKTVGRPLWRTFKYSKQKPQ